MYEHEKNNDFVIKLFNPLSKGQWDQVYSLINRVNRIVEPQANVRFLFKVQNNNGFRILVDAEQSYVQLAIECMS